ncbi:MAG: hypothetical protein KAS88_00705 [Deltaproteobacteria bacterium]|nr:hypothetical protein [Deltaproteobacteria bacterium]
MNVARGMRRVRIAITIITIPIIVLGVLITYIASVDIKSSNGALTLPGGPEVFESYSDGTVRALSPEDARESILYALKLSRKMRNLGIILLGLSAGLWGFYWIIAGFSSKKQPNQSLE